MPTTITQLQDYYTAKFNSLSSQDRNYYQQAIDMGMRVETAILTVSAISPLYASYLSMTGGSPNDYDFFATAMDKGPEAEKIRQFYQLLILNGFI